MKAFDICWRALWHKASERASDYLRLLTAPRSLCVLVQWDEETLALALGTCDGNAEAAIDVVLSAGSPGEFRAQQAPMQQVPFPDEQSTRNAARDAAVAEQERMFALATSARGARLPQPPPQQTQQPPPQPTAAAGVAWQERLMVTAPPGGAAGAVLSIKHNGADFFVTVTLASYILRLRVPKE